MDQAATKNVGRLLPHAAPMMLLNSVVAHGADYIETETVIHAGIPTNDGEGVPAYTGIELMAQTIAAYSGIADMNAERPPQIGFLLGVRHFHCHASRFANGEVLRMRATIVVQYEQLAVFACSIKIDGKIVVEAKLSVFSRGARELT